MIVVQVSILFSRDAFIWSGQLVDAKSCQTLPSDHPSKEGKGWRRLTKRWMESNQLGNVLVRKRSWI